MKYHKIKTKIDLVMESCESKDQFNLAYKYCYMLIDKYLVGDDNTAMSDFLWIMDIARMLRSGRRL